MSYNLEELAVVIAVIFTIVILSLFYGLFWSLLLVFTLLFLLYKYGRPRQKKWIKKSTTSFPKVDADDSENTMYSDGKLDVPFTGLPSPKPQSLRSPMPLLSTVTKRLSFNTSSFTPRDANRTIYRRSFGSPSPIISQQSPRHFSLINPKFQQHQQPTIKIAPPPVQRLNAVQEEAKQEPGTCDPLARSTILSALKQSTARKRAVYEDDDDVDYVTQQKENTKKKRRYNYDPVTTESRYAERTAATKSLDYTQDILVKANEKTKEISHSQTNQEINENSRDFVMDGSDNPSNALRYSGIGGLIQARLKRRPLHSDGDSRDESDASSMALTKRTRSESDVLQRRDQEVSQQVKPIESEKAEISSPYTRSRKRYADNSDGDSDSGCDADDDDDIVMKGATVPSEKLKKRAIQQDDNQLDRSLTSTPNYTPVSKNKMSKITEGTPAAKGVAPRGSSGTPGKGRLSKKQMMAMKQSHSIEVTSSPARQTDISEEVVEDSPGKSTTPKKRFSVVRFASRNNESKRRAVPVYCASVDSPDLHKRQPSSSHKITKQDIEQDRKLAWKKIQSFLEASDEEEDTKDTNTNTGGATSPSIAINVVTCTSPPRSTLTTTLTTTTTGGFSSLGQTSASIAQTTSALSLTTTATALTATPVLSTSVLPSPLTTTLTATANAPSTSIALGITPLSTKSENTAAATSNTMGVTLGTPSKTSSTLGISPLNPQTPTSLTTQASLDPKKTTSTLSSNISQTNPNVHSGLTAPQVGANTSITGLNPLTTAQAGLKTSTMFSNPIPARSVKPDEQLQGKPVTFGLNPVTPNPASTAPRSTESSLFAGLNKTTASSVTTTSSTPGLAHSAPSMGFTFGSKQTATDKTGATFAAAAPRGLFGASSGIAQKRQDPTKTSTATTTSGQGGFTFGQPANNQAQQSTPQKSGFTFGNPAAQPSSTTTVSKSLFGSTTAKESSSTTAPFGAATTQSAFGAGSTQSPFGSAQNAFGASTQNAFGATSSQNTPSAPLTQKPAFGASTQIAFGAGTSTTKAGFSSSSTQKTFGASTTQNAFGSSTTQNAFGASTTQNAFGATTNKNAFGATTTQNAFGGSTTPKPFGATNPPSNTFGAGGTIASTTPFGSGAKPSFGSTPTQNAFGKPAATSGFGSTSIASPFGSQNPAPSSGGFNFNASKPLSASSGATAGGFNFAAGPSTAGSSSIGGFNFTSASNSNSKTAGFAFGGASSGTNSNSAGGGGFNFAAGATQNSSGFNFSNSNSNQTNSNSAGGFNFAPSNSKPSSGGGGGGGFAFGNTATPGGFQFGAAQQNTQNAAPTFGSPAPSGGFNFTAGSNTPTFGASSTPGGFAFGASAQTPSSAVAKARPKATARRRTRK